jgi:hypothetical protein
VAFQIVQSVIRERFSLVATEGGGRFTAGPGVNFPDKSFTFQTGTVTGQVNKAYIGTLAVTNGGTTSIDLTAVTYAGTLQNFTAVKFLQVALSATTTADTNPTVIIGPQGVANGAILCFGTTTGSHDVRSWYQNMNQINGWAVTASNKVIQFQNNGSHPIGIYVNIQGTG